MIPAIRSTNAYKVSIRVASDTEEGQDEHEDTNVNNKELVNREWRQEKGI